MEQDPTLPNQTADSQKSLVTKLINHYEPNVDVTDDYYKSISEKYQDVDTLVTKLINHYEPDSEVTTDYLDGLYGKYGVKKKEQTEPTQQVQAQEVQTQDAPLQGLGGVSEEPTPSPSVGQGVLRDVDQTQPTGEEFISGLTETATDRTSNLTDPERTRNVKRKGRLTKFSAEQNGIVGEVTYEDGTKKELAQDEYDALEKQEGLFDIDLGLPLPSTPDHIQFDDEVTIDEEAEDYIPEAEEIAERQKLYEGRIQSERNENLKKYSLNVPNEELTEVFREPISEEENLDSYLSTQIGKVSSSARNIANNPKAFGLPSDINLITPQEREDVVDQYVARATKLGFGRRISENSPNLNESELRNVFNNEFDKALAKKKTDKDVLLRKQRNEDLDKRNIPEESRRTIDLIDLKKQDVASMTNTKEVELYSSNRKLQDIADKLSSTKDPIKLDELTSEYNKELSKSNSLREEIGDDREVMVDYITGQHVDNISDDDDANITEAVNAQIVEFSQPTYKDQLDDLYIKVGLRDNSHKEYGSNFKNDVYVATQGMARPLSSDAALNHLRSMGYETEGKVGGVVFKDVPLNVQASSYVINVLPDKGKKEAERWLQENKKNIIEREALKDMVLLNVDPGKYDKSKLARGLEVLAEESLPSYVSVDKALGFTSDRKLIDAVLPLLQEEGIELTKEQEENLERTFGEEATEATFGMVPVIVKLAAINSIAGPLRAVSGFGNLVDKLSKSKSLVDKGIALFLDASFEEVQMQTAGFDPGTGFGFNVAGKIFKGIGLDKFPFKGKGEMARFNKSADALWNHAIKGASSAEFASNVEAVIKDFEGGETWQNFADENYSNLSDVTKRMLVNGVAFGVLGLRDVGFFIKKGKSGFNISNMEKARDESQRKGYKEEADMLTKYINEYYAGKKTSWEVQLTPEEKSAIRNRMARAGETGDVEIQEWFSKNPKEGKKVLKKGIVSVGTFDKIKSLFGIRPEIIRDLSESKVEKVGENYEVKLLTDGKEVGSYKTESKEEAEAVSNEINADLKEKESVGETTPTVTEPTGETVPAKRKGMVNKFSAKKGDIVGEIVFEDGTKKELTQEEYDALGKQEGLFDVEVPVEKKITKEEYEMEMAKKFAETQPTPKEPAAKEQLALGEGKAAPKEDAPVEILSKSIDVSDDSNRKGLATVEQLKDFIGEDRVGNAEMPTSRETIDKLKEDIKENGFKEPIVVVYDKLSGEGEASIIEGNHRMQAAIELGLKEVPVKFEKGTLRTNEQREADGMFPLNRETVGEIDTRFGVDGTKLGLDVRQPTETDVVTKTEQDAVQKQEAADVPKAEQPKIEPLTKEEAKSEEKVKDFVEKNLESDEKKSEADNEIESKSEEELKEDVPDVLESISESERERLDREAKFKKKSTVDYVIDYLKGKLKNVRQSIKNILEKIKSNYKRIVIATGIVTQLFAGSYKAKLAYEYISGKDVIEAYETGGKESAAIKFAEENPEIFKTSLDILKHADASPKLAGRLSNVGIKAGVIEPVKLKYKENDYAKEDGITDGYFDRKTNEEIIEIVEDRNGLKIASTRSTFPAAKGTEVILQGNNAERKAAGKKEVEGAKYIAHYGLDDNVLSGKRHKDTPPIHRRSMKIDGFVPYVLKRVGDRVVYTYKRYSEIADTSKDIYEVLKDRNILDPLRQYNYDDIQWEDTVGAEVYLSSSELLLKDGTPNVYREGIKTHDAGKAAHPLGTYIMWTPNSKKMNTKGERNGQTNYGRYNGGSFLLLFNDKHGNPFVRNFTGSVDGIRREGESVAKEFGIPTSEITIAFHDAGSVSGKPVAVDGKITERENHMVNDHNPNATFGYVVPEKNEILTDTADPISGDKQTPIGLMALPLLFGGARRKRKPLEDTDSDKVVTEWMGDVQKIYDAQKTKNKEEARNQAAVNLALSGKLDKLAPDQVKAVLEGIQTETGAMGKKWSVSTLSELEGLTIKEQFKQGFEEYVAAMKQKESDKIQKAKETAQAKIDAVKERTAKAVEKIKAKKEAEKIEYKDKIKKLKEESKADKEARKLFEAIVNDIAKDAGLSQISRNKAEELLKSSRDVNAENIERLLEKAVRVIEYEYKRSIVKESDKKIKDFKTNIEKNEFGTLTQSAKELAGITTEDIPIGLLPRFVDVMDGVSKKSPSAKDLEELAKFMSEFKNELDQQITDVQYFADVLNDFKTQEETEKIDDYLKENGFSESQIEFFKNNRKAINAAYKSFYQKETKQKDGSIKIEDLSAQKIFNKKEEQMLEAIKVFKQMEAEAKKNEKSKVDMNKFKGKVQQELNTAEFFNKIKASDIKYLSRTEANKIPVVFENLNRGMVTNTTDKIMSKIIGGRTLDSFEKLDPKSPIKRAETIDGIFKSFSSNSKEIKALGLKSDPISLKSSREAFDQIKEKVLDYSDEVFKDLKGKPLYEQVGKIMRPIVNVNIKMAKIFDEINDLERKMDGSPLYNTVLMDMYFRSREFDLNPDNKRAMNPIEYIEATLESGDLLASQREVIKDIKNTYFRKKQGDQKSKPNTKEMLNEIKKRKGGALIELMDKTLESYQPIVQFISEVKQSSPVDWYKGYFTRSSLENGSKGIEDLLSDVSNNVGRPSLKAGAAQSRQPGKHALNFNAIDNFKKSIASIELQYNAGQAISEVNAFISEAKRSGNMDAKIFAETLKKVVDAYVKNTLSQEYKDSKIFGNRLTAKFFDSAGKKIKTATLAGALKVVKDGTAQTGKILIDEDARNALFKLVSLRKESKIPSTQEILDTLKSLHSARSGVLSAEMRKNQSYVLDALRKGTATSTEKALYSLSKLKGVELASALDNFLMNFSTGLIKSPDLMGTVQLVVGASAIKFKEITGQELDFNKLVSSPEYRAKYKEELEAAVSYGDQITTRIGGPGTVSQKPINEISEKNRLRIMDRFVRAFPTFESQQIQSAISTLIPPASKFTGRERGAEFENKRKAAQGLLASIYGLVGYASIGIVLNELADYAIMFLLGYEDDDELFQDFDSEAASTRVVSDVAWTSMFGKYGVTKTLILQSSIAGGVRLAGEFAENKEDKELANKIADSMFYSTINKKTTVQRLAKSSGPEGKLVGAAAELIYDISDDIVGGLNEESGKPKPYKSETKLLENPRFVQNLYTLSQGVISQGPAQEIGKLVRTSTYEQDLSRKMNEAFGGRPSDESRSSLDNTENKILRLRKRTGDRYLIPSMVSMTKTITKKGVKVKFKLNQATVYELQRLKAKFIKGEAEKLFKTNTYKNANDSEKSKLLKEIYGDWNGSNSGFIEKFYLSKGKVVR